MIAQIKMMNLDLHNFLQCDSTIIDFGSSDMLKQSKSKRRLDIFEINAESTINAASDGKTSVGSVAIALDIVDTSVATTTTNAKRRKRIMFHCVRNRMEHIEKFVFEVSCIFCVCIWCTALHIHSL